MCKGSQRAADSPRPVSVANDSDEGKETENSHQGNEGRRDQVISCRVKTNSSDKEQLGVHQIK